ncbi:MAG TPA: hypothetical protein VL101_08590 [Nordella sp.]|nr:hypothetical protein [Nordella sp.]
MLAISKSTIATQIVEELRRRIIADDYHAEPAVSLLRTHILNATAHLPEMAKPEDGSPQ